MRPQLPPAFSSSFHTAAFISLSSSSLIHRFHAHYDDDERTCIGYISARVLLQPSSSSYVPLLLLLSEQPQIFQGSGDLRSFWLRLARTERGESRRVGELAYTDKTLLHSACPELAFVCVSVCDIQRERESERVSEVAPSWSRRRSFFGVGGWVGKGLLR